MWLHVYASKVGVEFTALAWGSVRDEEAAEKASNPAAGGYQQAIVRICFPGPPEVPFPYRLLPWFSCPAQIHFLGFPLGCVKAAGGLGSPGPRPSSPSPPPRASLTFLCPPTAL